jgi:hypothetical protein
MARPRKIEKATETRYFQDVTPLWVPPGQKPIEYRYCDAIDALVEWVGSEWVNIEASNFFPMRAILVKSCESWVTHDWQSDVSWIEERKVDAKQLPDLNRAFSKFAIALGKAPFRHKKKMLSLALLSEMQAESATGMTNQKAIGSVERAIEWFGQYLTIKDRAYARYGAIEYASIPKQLPQREIAIALSLADQITFWRRDGLSEGTLHCPHKPTLSKNLPWKAIALFASANCGEPLDTATIQTRVTSLARKVALVHWRGDAPTKAEPIQKMHEGD